MSRLAPWACLAVLSAGLWGCATAEGLRLDRRAAELGLRSTVIRGGAFTLRAYVRDPAGPDRDEPLHREPLRIYLEGDGRPWIDGRHVAADPHGRRNVALELMARDPGPAVYLGRPCYHPVRVQDPCEPFLWTHGRYSEAVVASLESALTGLIAERGVDEVALVGYSGGGVLARLLAARVPEVTSLVTVAANLDLHAWTRLHGYEPLVGSLDPAKQPPLPERVRQLHWVGGRDRNVPPSLVMEALRIEGLGDRPSAEIRVLPEFDHVCCWVEHWPELLRATFPSHGRLDELDVDIPG